MSIPAQPASVAAVETLAFASAVTHTAAARGRSPSEFRHARRNPAAMPPHERLSAVSTDLAHLGRDTFGRDELH